MLFRVYVSTRVSNSYTVRHLQTDTTTDLLNRFFEVAEPVSITAICFTKFCIETMEIRSMCARSDSSRGPQISLMFIFFCRNLWLIQSVSWFVNMTVGDVFLVLWDQTRLHKYEFEAEALRSECSLKLGIEGNDYWKYMLWNSRLITLLIVNV